MAPMSEIPALVGPFERTAQALAVADRRAAFRGLHRDAPHRRLAESDALLAHVEHCRLEADRQVGPGLWAAVSRWIGTVDPGLRVRLGGDRTPDHVTDVLFDAQAQLMQAAVDERSRPPAEIIPLFPA